VDIADLPLETYLRLLLRGEYEQTGDERPRFDTDGYRRMARRMRTKCARPTFYPDPRHFALPLGINPLCEHVEGCYGEVNEGDDVLYSCKGGPRSWGLRVYHGIAHWILRTWYADEYEESDAWLLTIELACIGDHLLDVGPDAVAAENEFVPMWLVRMYFSALRMAALNCHHGNAPARTF
jgi:hypothetical protein